MSKNLPEVMPGGALLPFMSAARFTQIANTVFEAIGGTERLIHEADKDYKWFMEKVFVKAQPKHADLNGAAANGIEDLLEKSRKARDAGIIDITPEVVDDAD